MKITEELDRLLLALTLEICDLEFEIRGQSMKDYQGRIENLTSSLSSENEISEITNFFHALFLSLNNVESIPIKGYSFYENVLFFNSLRITDFTSAFMAKWGFDQAFYHRMELLLAINYISPEVLDEIVENGSKNYQVRSTDINVVIMSESEYKKSLKSAVVEFIGLIGNYKSRLR